MTTSIFILQGSKLVYEDGVFFNLKIQIVMEFLSEKFEDKELSRTVVCFWLLYGIGN